MIQPDLIAYLKQAKAEGHSLDSVKSVLLQQGWSQQDVNESMIAVSAPSAPVASVAVPKPISPVTPMPKPQLPKKVVYKVPDFYISPLSVLLAVVLFLSLFFLTGRILEDVEGVIAPYSGKYAESSPAYKAASEKYNRNISLAEKNRIQSMWNTHHESDQIKHLFVAGVVSAVYWVLAFVVHHFIGGSRKQYLPLSVPFFVTAGIYLITTLGEAMTKLFQEKAHYAVYITLILFIIIATGSFMFYQKRSHAEPHL